MQVPISLRAGVHIEQSSTLTIVHAMLARAGHYSLVDIPGLHSLTAYLEIVLKQIQNALSSPYDLLILGSADADTFADNDVLASFVRLLAVKPLPIIVITDASNVQLQEWRRFPNVSIFPESSLPMRQFFQTLDRLTQSFSGIPNPSDVESYERLIEEERSRLAVRRGWLDQRQEWLDQRKIWLDQRQEWLEAMEKGKDPQSEWLSEQRAWLKEQSSELENQQRKVNDLRRWLNNYQRRIDEENPDTKRSAQ